MDHLKGESMLGPYRLLKPLGEGGMARVYLAEVVAPRAGLKPGDKVAIKVLHQHLVKEPGCFERFRVEADLGIKLKHPHVVRTLDVGVTGTVGKAHHYLVMEPVEGQTVRNLLKLHGTLSDELCRRIARAVAEALVAIHDIDIVHRDLKPENILIDNRDCVKVMDLGVAFLKRRTIRLSATGQFVGSVYYAAPEQILKGGKDLDARVDLYQLGLLLYESLTGVHPYRHKSLGETLKRLLHHTPTKLSELNEAVSPFLEAVVQRLMYKEREARFSSAKRLLQVLTRAEASRWWSRWQGRAQARTRSFRLANRPPRETPLHGRDAEITQLRDRFAEAVLGRGQTLLIEGEAGIGKSRLVEEFRDELSDGSPDASTLCGAYAEGKDAAAEGAFSAAFREYLGENRVGAELTRLMDRAQLLMPAFAAVLRGTTPPPESEKLTYGSLLQLFEDLLTAIARRGPVALVIEDLHHAHEGGIVLFERLATRVRELPVLLIGTTRPGPLSSWAADLAAGPNVSHTRLTRLSRADLRTLLFDALGSWRLADALLEKIAEKSDGKPLYVFELLRELKEKQFLGIRPDGSWISTREIRELSVPATLKDLISARIAELDQGERRLLELASCAGFEFEPRMVARAGGLGTVPALRLIESLENDRRLIRATQAGFSFDEHLIQEIVYQGLGEDRRKEFHRALVNGMLRTRSRGGFTGASAVAFCKHAIRGGCPEVCLPDLDHALDHLDDGHLNGPAVELLESALGIEGLLTGFLRLRILTRLADHLDRLARRTREWEVLSEMKALAEEYGDRRAQARVCRSLGRHHQSVCNYRQALAAFRKAAALSGLSRDMEEEAAAIGMLAIVHARLGENEEAATYQDEAVRLAGECGSPHARHVHRANLGIVFHGLGRYEEARRHHEEFLAILGAGENPRQEMRHSERLARTLAAEGDYGRALRQLERSLAVAWEIGDRQGEGIAYLSLGLVNRDLGRMDEAERLLEQARCLFQQIGLVEGEAAAQRGLGRLAEDYGLVDRAEILYGESLDLSREIGTKGAMVDSLLARGRLRSSVGSVVSAAHDLSEARSLAHKIRRPDPLVLAVSYLVLLRACESGAMEEALAGNPGVRRSVMMEVHHVLHRATGKVEHLRAARELLNGLIDRAPPELRDSMLSNVPLHREISLACEN